MPPRSQYALVTGGAYTVIEGNQYIGAHSSDEGMRILYEHACPGALHDSGERFDPPNCHPNTRVAVRQAIIDWLNDEGSEFVAMWMKGAMGAGKSSIAQTIAQLLHDLGQLSASFFFSRSSNSGRNDHTRLVATLAYQMSKEIPETRPLIASAVAGDHLIFEASLQTQLETLITDTLSRIPPSADGKPRLIIIDGLDECADPEAQKLIVKVFVSTLARIKDRLQIPHKILIASRPEADIEAAFRDHSINSYVKSLPLDDSWNPDEDIRKFLLDSFSEIKLTHDLGSHIPENWPPAADLNKLVEKSSGQFIYASIVIKFLKSPRNHPVHCLKIILGLVKDTKSRPYAELDALYAHIFSRVHDLDLVMSILCLRLIRPTRPLWCGINNCESFLDVPAGMINIALSDLASIITIEREAFPVDIRFLHASLPEYLLDKDRSGKYYMHSDVLCECLVLKCLEVMLHADENFRGHSVHRLAVNILTETEIMAHLKPDVRAQVYKNISSKNFMHYYQLTVNSKDRIKDDTMSQFIRWILETYTLLDPFPDNPLAMAFRNIQNWILDCFKTYQFNGFDNTEGWDLWIFVAFSFLMLDKFKERSDTISKYISDLADLLLDKRGISLITTHLDTSSLVPCWFLLSYFQDHNVDFYYGVDGDWDNPFGVLPQEYAFTGRRYADATLRILQDIIHLKKIEWITGAWFTGAHPATICQLLHRADPDRRVYDMLKSIMVDDTCAMRSQIHVSTKEGISQAYKYLWQHYTSQPMSFQYPLYRSELARLTTAFGNYVKRTQEAFPDLNTFLVEEGPEERPEWYRWYHPADESELKHRITITALTEETQPGKPIVGDDSAHTDK